MLVLAEEPNPEEVYNVELESMEDASLWWPAEIQLTRQ
jgi:hypothetical protein